MPFLWMLLNFIGFYVFMGLAAVVLITGPLVYTERLRGKPLLNWVAHQSFDTRIRLNNGLAGINVLAALVNLIFYVHLYRP